MPTGLERGSPFEAQVISVLREKGWTVHPQVGVFWYQIDIGVVALRAPGRYLLGVEFDGRTYHSGATARDRDRLRQHILEGLGWELYRIWSTNWWMNPQEPMRKLFARLEELVTQGIDEVIAFQMTSLRSLSRWPIILRLQEQRLHHRPIRRFFIRINFPRPCSTERRCVFAR
jgi:very-short-patch-repair endonuclease